MPDVKKELDTVLEKPLSPANRRLALLKLYPDYCTVADVARMHGCDKRNVRHFVGRIKNIVVDGMMLFERRSAVQHASVYAKDPGLVGRLGVVGNDVQRLQRICEHYYRCQFDAGPPELVKLAKRIARL